MIKGPWRVERGQSPLVAVAIHDGHSLRDEIQTHMSLDDASRLREEDPFTGQWTAVASTRVIVAPSRFEMDLNRPREKAVYRTPEDAWGLEVWKNALPEALARRSLAQYDVFYLMLYSLFKDLEQRHGRFVVYDIHSYNHRRQGPTGPIAPAQENPQVNVGTGTMTDRTLWEPVIGRFISDLAGFDFPGGRLDVRENVKFRGGELARWAHTTFPASACVLSIEVKKFFMDEWTGRADQGLLRAMAAALQSTTRGVLEELKR